MKTPPIGKIIYRGVEPLEPELIFKRLRNRSTPAQKDYFLSIPTTVNLPALAAATPTWW
jgi:hypothetical protein